MLALNEAYPGLTPAPREPQQDRCECRARQEEALITAGCSSKRKRNKSPKKVPGGRKRGRKQPRGAREFRLENPLCGQKDSAFRDG